MLRPVYPPNFRLPPSPSAFIWSLAMSRLKISIIFVASLAVARAEAIEMFTNFHNGENVGFPPMEVPIRMYPGFGRGGWAPGVVGAAVADLAPRARDVAHRDGPHDVPPRRMQPVRHRHEHDFAAKHRYGTKRPPSTT